MTSPTILFLHVPKAAGTSLISILRKVYGRYSVYGLSNLDLDGSIKDYINLSFDEKSRIKAIHGHFLFGIHRYVPSQFSYITFIREPVKRVVSHYHHIRNHPDHYAYQQGFNSETTLLEYIHSDIAFHETHDGQVWLLSGGVQAEGFPSLALTSALENLNKFFTLAAPSEMFDEAVIILKDKLNWKKLPLFYRRHIGVYKPVGNPDQDCSAEISQVNLNDLELYHQVKEQFLDQVRQAGSDFKRRVRTYQFLNRLYENAINLRHQGGNFLRSVGLRRSHA